MGRGACSSHPPCNLQTWTTRRTPSKTRHPQRDIPDRTELHFSRKKSYHCNPVDPRVPSTHLLLLRGSASSQWEGLAVLTTQRRDQLAQERLVELAAVQLLFLPTAVQTDRSRSLMLRSSAASQWEGLGVVLTQRRDLLAQESVVELASVQLLFLLLFLPTATQTGRSCSGSEPTRMALSQHWADFPTKEGSRN
jgi:hypothetical protein